MPWGSSIAILNDMRPFLLPSLIVANLVAVVSFIFFGGSILQVLWIYWTQSVVIGLVNVVRIATMSDITSMRTAQGAPLAPSNVRSLSKVIRSFLSVFFVLHYGGFHAAYAMILVWLAAPTINVVVDGSTSTITLNEPAVSVAAVVIGGMVFAMHHVLSYMVERSAHKVSPLPVLALVDSMARPYSRIIPMHAIIVLGPLVAIAFGNTGVFIAFMLLKTLADIFLFKRGVSHRYKTYKQQVLTTL